MQSTGFSTDITKILCVIFVGRFVETTQTSFSKFEAHKQAPGQTAESVQGTSHSSNEGCERVCASSNDVFDP